ncbi:unnamed protein product [Symbiodinium sp. CCMP2456]|nr:unnamed protein product [Symbiodinium sp. CCMP2456]
MSGRATAVGVEPLVVDLVNHSPTPYLKSTAKIMLSIVESQMKEEVKKSYKDQVNVLLKAFDICSKDAEEAGGGHKTTFDAENVKHALCRKDEAAAYSVSEACNKELTAAGNEQKTQCDELIPLESSQSRSLLMSREASDEGHEEQLKRLQNLIAANLAAWGEQKDKCTNATAAAATKKSECDPKAAALSDLREKCNGVQDTMDSASCSYYRSMDTACNECYKSAKTNYENGKSLLKTLEQEWDSIMKIQCLLQTFVEQDGAKEGHIKKCNDTDHDGEMDLKLTFPPLPAMDCKLPNNTAGSQSYANLYRLLPADAPAKICAADCCVVTGWVKCATTPASKEQLKTCPQGYGYKWRLKKVDDGAVCLEGTDWCKTGRSLGYFLDDYDVWNWHNYIHPGPALPNDGDQCGLTTDEGVAWNYATTFKKRKNAVSELELYYWRS